MQIKDCLKSVELISLRFAGPEPLPFHIEIVPDTEQKDEIIENVNY